ncbi:MAG: 23S rRNA (guanosine2251-2'-O)-methyltransferase [Candidatus Latescibacterota bacterium]|jgi:23S rRNA (guanosine2251-2'-O)-methyltransferase
MKLTPGNYGKETTFEVRNFDVAIAVEEYAELGKHPLYLVLDNLRSAFNVGSIFRSADAARLAGVFTCGYTAHPPHPKLDKTALGTLAYVPTRHFDTALEALAYLTAEGVAVWALETTSESVCYTDVEYPAPLALVLGNEALGVERPVLERCEKMIEIPMYGYKNSLNVAGAAAVAAFEALRQWKEKGLVRDPMPNA